jgi:lysyl-tRNA synthetase class 2
VTVRRSPPRGKRRRGPGAQILSPSDARASPGSKTRTVTVGGRVVHVSTRTVVLADALSTMPVSLGGSVPRVEPGDLLVVEGKLEGARLGHARVVARTAGKTPTAGSEFGRFGLDGTGARLSARSVALRAVRGYFEGEAFVEVETPVRVASPGLDAHVDALRAEDGFLITSPELHMKRLLVGGLPRVYQLARVSRAREHGDLHEPEFTMLEWYRAFSGMEAVVHDTEQLVARVIGELAGRPVARSPGGQAVEVRPPFRRLTMREAFQKHAGIADAADLARARPDDYHRLFVERVEPALARARSAIVLTEFPITEAALARPCPHDAAVAERFEVYVGGVELCNGFGELTDPAEQRRRFEHELERRRRAGAPEHPIDERFLTALEEGLPPSGGNALGFDRLVLLATGARRLSDVMAFPRDRP